MGLARATERIEAEPAAALGAWCDPSRWQGFVEGFARVLRVDSSWPAPGAELVWETGPHGRGRVAERVEEHERDRDGPARLVTAVSEEALSGTQAVEFTALDDGSSRAEVALEYRLAAGGPLAGLTDTLFIRRALRQSLSRTLERFAIEVQALR